MTKFSKETGRLLQQVYQQMVEDIDDVRTRNLVSKYLKDYQETEVYRNNPALVYKWSGAGRHTVERTREFLDEFYQEYLAITSGKHEGVVARLIDTDYPFLTDDEQAFVTSFLHTEGRYPVLYIASRYLKRTTNKQAQVFSKANGITGGHLRFEAIGEEYNLTRERVRQLSVMNITQAEDAGQVWNEDRWQAIGFLHLPVMTEHNTNWEELRQKEHLLDLDFYAALAIIRQMRPLNIVALRSDGRRANARRSPDHHWQMPDVLFAYDSRLSCFSFENALAAVGHDACLKRITDSRVPIYDFADGYFTGQHTEEDRQAVANILKEVLPLFGNVEPEGDDIVFRANSTNYMEEFYQILQRKGQAMTIDAIFEEFRTLHPDDHHTDSNFIRNYMLRDERFEAVGSKSTYQLKEWQQFSGALGDLAVHLLEDSEEPMTAEALCQKMMELRPSTTAKSCNTSIYIAVSTSRLLFYIDAEAYEDSDVKTNPEVSHYHVGLFNRKYSDRFWASPLTVEGTVRSMRRFVESNGRWPFSSAKTGIERTLYNALRKYATRRCVTDDELQRYQQGLADINPDDFPTNERDLQYLNRCRELTEYFDKHHRLPSSGKLLSWYQAQCSQAEQLTGFRKYQFSRLQTCIYDAQLMTPVTPIKYNSHDAEQLSLDFAD